MVVAAILVAIATFAVVVTAAFLAVVTTATTFVFCLFCSLLWKNINDAIYLVSEATT